MPAATRPVVVGLVLTVSLGIAGCASNDDTSDAKDKSSQSSGKDDSADWKGISEKALVSTELEMLSDHKPQLDEPSHPAKVELPFQSCAVDKVLYDGIQDSAFQIFDGEPTIAARGFAIDGSASKQFAKLREAWTSKDCGTYEAVATTDAGEYEYKDAEEIAAPKGIEADAWFGACYEGTGDGGAKIGECRAVYVVGDNALAELIVEQPVDENELNSLFLTLVAAESLVG